MKKGIVGKKIGMTQVFTEDGRLLPVTVIQAGPCPVVQKKTIEKDGYEAIQVGFDAYAPNRVEKLVNKPIKGLYATGLEVSKAVGHTYTTWTSGFAFGFACYSGRHAGLNAAQAVK